MEIDDTTKNDIRKWSHELLLGSHCFDVYPTQVNKLVAYSELQVSSTDLSMIMPKCLKEDDSVLKKLMKRIRGLLVRDEKLIYIDKSCCVERQNFTLLHEVGHTLPWQVQTVSMMGDDDVTLSPKAKEQFEIEASFFASETIFQGDRFTSLANKMPLCISTPIDLAHNFGASIHAALRRYVEYAPTRCALLVMEQSTSGDITLRDLFHSELFLSEIGVLPFPKILDFSLFPFVSSYKLLRHTDSGKFTILMNSERTEFIYEYFNNYYNGFVLIYPNK